MRVGDRAVVCGFTTDKEITLSKINKRTVQSTAATLRPRSYVTDQPAPATPAPQRDLRTETILYSLLLAEQRKSAALQRALDNAKDKLTRWYRTRRVQNVARGMVRAGRAGR